MTILVLGATGAQGGAVARRLVAEGHRVRGFGRSGQVPAGVEPVTGPLEAALDGVTHVSLVLPMMLERAELDRWVEVVAGSRVRRVVFNTANRIPSTVTDVALFESRRAASDALLASGVPTVVLRPPVYLDNLRAPWVAGRLAAERVLSYPLPADLPVAWISHDDLAAATVAALTRDGLEGGVLDVGGPESLTGPQLAAAFGATYEAQDVAAFQKGLTHVFGQDTAATVAATYHWLAKHGGDLYAADPSAAERLGVRFTPVHEWIAA